MFETIEEFAEVSQLNDVEVNALKEIVADPELSAEAKKLADICFAPGAWDGKNPPQPEGGDYSKIRFGAAFFAAPRVPEFFAPYGFPESVMRETMTDLKVWLRNELKYRKVCGLSFRALEWQGHLYRGWVTRHGRLECCSEYKYHRETLRDENGNILLEPGDQVIELHIPEDGPMDIDECIKSMHRMAEFFAEYRKDIQWKGFLCESWLLDRQFRDMLSPDSNIVKFQDLGIHYPVGETRDSVFRIFGTPETDPDSVENPTSLQRKTAEFIRNGGKFMEEGMFITKDILK